MTPGDEARQAVVERLSRLTTEWADHRALQFEGRWWRWADVGRLAQSLRWACDERGGVPDRFVVVLRQRPVMVAAELAVLALGSTAVLVSPLLGDTALAADLDSLDAPLVVVHREDAARSGLLAGATAPASAVLVLDDDGTPELRPARAQAQHSVQGTPSAALTVLTSGTTGTPKRLPVAWQTFVTTGGGSPGRPPADGRGALILTLPLTTLGGFTSIAQLVFGGRPMALMERFDLQAWLALVREHRPSVIGAPPPVVRMILDAEVPPAAFEGVTAFVTASAAVPTEVAAAFEARYGFPVLVGYGATEFLGAVSSWTTELWREFGPSKAGSAGRPQHGARLRVVDPQDGTPLAAGDEGVLEVDPPRRADGLPEGWLRTNDRARIDADGFLWVLGRTDDVIVRGGFKVDLAAVERALRAHPGVEDALAVGIPDARLGTVPAALVTVVAGTDADPDGIVASTRTSLPAYAVPVEVRVVDVLPRTATMKPARAQAAALFDPSDR